MKTKVILGGCLLVAVGLAGALSSEKKETSSGDVLHEWGTFTTVSGSDGVLLTGLEREEEHLPGFEYSHAGMENGTLTDPGTFVMVEDMVKFEGGKPMPPHLVPMMNMMRLKGFHPRRQLRGVAVKMETPVVYFYTDEEVKVDLRVGFKGGSISQWFPHRSAGEVVPKMTQFWPMVAKEGEEVPSLEEQEKAMGLIDFGKDRDGWIGAGRAVSGGSGWDGQDLVEELL
ncbi:MAG: hypothetical protein OSA48_09880 [Akkermansiaceae bacterium]|nr:hypothetical protein [Akkermansiaceae bacterium]